MAHEKFVQSLFMEESSADIVVEVLGGGEGKDSKKFYAHCLILKKNAPGLFIHLCKTTSEVTTFLLSQCKQIANILGPNVLIVKSIDMLSQQETTIEIIHGIPPDIFYMLLQYIYGHTIPDLGKDQLVTIQIIDAADKFGIINLKHEAETFYVQLVIITLVNVMEQFHYADSKTLPSLREKGIDFIIENKAEIVEKKILLNSTLDVSAPTF